MKTDANSSVAMEFTATLTWNNMLLADMQAAEGLKVCFVSPPYIELYTVLCFVKAREMETSFSV